MKTAIEFFEEISRIPRPSGREKAICDHLEGFARARGLRYRRDETQNIVIWKDAAPGYENAPAVLLQGHTDIVAQKTAASAHDFAKDPIRILKEGDIWRADGTTLGGDNGVAVAMMMALLDDPDAAHPALECVFTSREEIGLIGAMRLDASDLRSTAMVNLDCGPEGDFTVSCAGGRRVRVKRALAWEAARGETYTLAVRGLLGGHSGLEIGLGRGNALVLLGRAVAELTRAVGARLSTLSGGGLDNVIASDATCAVVCSRDPSATVAALNAMFREELAASDPGVELALSRAGDAPQMLAKADHDAVLGLLALLPHGVREMGAQAGGMVEASANFGSASVNAEGFEMNLSLRSASDSRKEALYREAEAACAALGAQCAFDGDYPGWAYEPVSPLRDKLGALYRAQTGREPEVHGVHAGLECGIFKAKMPALDIVAIGPRHGDVHSTDEWLDIASLQRTYELVRALLKDMR